MFKLSSLTATITPFESVYTVPKLPLPSTLLLSNPLWLEAVHNRKSLLVLLGLINHLYLEHQHLFFYIFEGLSIIQPKRLTQLLEMYILASSLIAYIFLL